VILDTFSIDTRPPFGVPILWPFWTGHIAAPVGLFLDIQRDRDTALFFGSLLRRHNLLAALWELVVMSVVIACTCLVVRGRKRGGARWRRAIPGGRHVADGESEV
jgi:hypothetical protein